MIISLVTVLRRLKPTPCKGIVWTLGPGRLGSFLNENYTMLFTAVEWKKILLFLDGIAVMLMTLCVGPSFFL